MESLLPVLSSKTEVDDVIRSVEDLVLVLRFGRMDDPTCMALDDIVSFPPKTILTVCSRLIIFPKTILTASEDQPACV